jgi:pimeloyl-ACP methyl ester carboxylesterase
MPYINTQHSCIFYEKEGAGREIVIFSHGLFVFGSIFAKQIDHLKNHYQCIIYDHCGQGKSRSTTITPMCLETLYLDTVSLIEQLADRPIHFVGLSMGGYIGMRLAARRPDLLKTLTLMATSSMSDNFLLRLKINILMAAFSLGWKQVFTHLILSNLFGDSFLNDEYRRDEKNFWKNNFSLLNEDIIDTIKALEARKAFTAHLSAITLPTLILSGSEDKIFPLSKMCDLFQIPNRKLIKIPQAGHSLCWENSVLVNNILSDFFNSYKNIDSGITSSAG